MESKEMNQIVKLQYGDREVRFEYQAANGWYYMKSNTGYRTITKVVEVGDLARIIKNYERRGFAQAEV